MARALTAYLKREKVPERTALQQAIAALKFPLTLDDLYVPFETSGYLPCTLDGEDAAAEPAPPSSLGDRDTALICKWGGDAREEVAALLVCAALAKNFDALVLEGGPQTPLSFEQLVAKAKSAQD